MLSSNKLHIIFQAVSSFKEQNAFLFLYFMFFEYFEIIEVKILQCWCSCLGRYPMIMW